jgi:hypothetical protein
MNKNVKRIMDNLSSYHLFNTTLTIDDVNYWLENFSDIVFCKGRVRKVKFSKITDKIYKVYSEEI